MKPNRLRGRAASARTALLATMIVSATAGTVLADPPGPAYWLYDRSPAAPLQLGQFFIGLNTYASRQHVPRWNSTYSIFTPGGSFLLPSPVDPDVFAWQPGGEIGYAFRDGTLPPWMGSRVRVAAFGSYATGERTFTSGANVPAGSTLHVVGLNGVSQTGPGPLTFGASPTFGDTLKFERDFFQLGLKLESDWALGPNLSLTPAIAVFGGWGIDKYEYNAGTTAGAVSIYALDERLRTTEFGGHLGARLTWQFMPGWALHAGGTVGPVWLHSRLNASQCFVAAGTVCGSGPALAAGTSSLSDSDNTLGLRATGSLGVAADMRIAIISVGGFMRYDTRIPGVENPQVTTPTAVSTGTSARIIHDSGFAYGGFVSIRVPLP